MLTKFFAEQELRISNVMIPKGELVATLDIPSGVPAERIVNAIYNGHITVNEPKSEEKK